MLKTIVLLAVALLLLAIAAVIIKIAREGIEGFIKSLAGKIRGLDLPYEKVQSLFTPNELAFLAALDQAIAGRHRIMGKVRLADVVDARSGLDNSARTTALNRIQRKHLDFVACDPKTMAVQFVIELDDKSHRRPDRQERDQFLDQVMQATGIPIFHFPAQRSYSPEEIKAKLGVK